MSDPECRNYETCEAPLCPRDDRGGDCVWYPDEPVCKLKEAPPWVKLQRRVAKALGHLGLDAGVFTVKMLSNRFPVRAGTRGLDPDSDLTPGENEARWLKNRRPIKATGRVFGVARKALEGHVEGTTK